MAIKTIQVIALEGVRMAESLGHRMSHIEEWDQDNSWAVCRACDLALYVSRDLLGGRTRYGRVLEERCKGEPR